MQDPAACAEDDGAQDDATKAAIDVQTARDCRCVRSARKMTCEGDLLTVGGNFSGKDI